MAYSPRSIDAMMSTYSKFGLDNNQLSQLRQILQTNKNVGPQITNQLVTDAARNDLAMGYGYLSEGNRPGIAQSRQNLLQFIDKYKSAPQPAIKSPVPTVKGVAEAFTNNPNLKGKMSDADLKVFNDVANNPSAPKPQAPTPKPTQAQTFASQKVEQVKQATKPKITPSGHNVRIKEATKGVTPKGLAPAPVAAPLKAKPSLGGVAGKAVPGVFTAVETAQDIAAGQNPLIAAGRNISGTLGGLMSASVGTLLAGEPTVEMGLTNKFAFYNEGNKSGKRAFDTLMGRLGVDTGRGLREVPEPKNNLTELEDGSLRTGSGDVYSSDGSRYTTSSGVTYDMKTGQAINPATNEISPTGYSIDPKTNKRTDAKGGLTFQKVNTLLESQNIEGFTPNENFDSNQLPTTSNSPYDFSSEDARAFEMSEEDSKLRESGQAVETVFDKGVESSGQIFKDPGSRAFLDYEGGSMGALRAAERARGMVTVGNQAYIPNPLAGQDGENDFLRINDGQKRNINAGRITAQDISNGHVNRINGADVGSDSQLVDFSNTYETGFGIQPMMTSLDATKGNMYSQELPDMTKKAGFFYEETPIFQVSPEMERSLNPKSPFFQMKN